MKVITFAVVLATLCILGVSSAKGQIQHTIVPMQSTCSDVEMIVGMPTCKTSHEVYDLKTEKIIVDFSTQRCQSAYKKLWDIPLGTVISVVRIPKKPFPLNQAGIDLKGCELSKWMSDIPNSFTYACGNIGLSISVQNDLIHQLIYYPIPSDSSLICKESC
ncbi:MAG: hypothetical protein KA956_11125 [Pyrinomonadaceae bacterium]|nr:hypothetical protein [Acidobacteriota bacterium]MBP7377017.1 hypothetical protein [Pyrinomonadaceae bacterium]